MHSTEVCEAHPAPLSRIQKLKQRILGINRLFLLTVCLPTTLAIIYYGFIASDIYISESHFVIRSPEKQQINGIGALLQGAGFSRSQDDTYTVHDYITSRDALQQLNRQYGIAAAYGSSKFDRIKRFGGLYPDASFEALHKYYEKQIVEITNESSSSITTLKIRAFSADEAQKINESLIEMSEQLVNRLNERGRQDMIRFAQTEVAQAETQAKGAAMALSSFRNKKGVFDPEKQSGLQLQLVSKLQEDLIATKTQLAQIRSVTRDNPQVPVLQKRLEVLQGEIAAETAMVAGGGSSLSGQAAGYERLALEQEFAGKQLAAALSTLELARNEAMRKQLYLERVVQPNLPDHAEEPKRLRNIASVFMLGLIVWGILSILNAGVREHYDR